MLGQCWQALALHQLLPMFVAAIVVVVIVVVVVVVVVIINLAQDKFKHNRTRIKYILNIIE